MSEQPRARRTCWATYLRVVSHMLAAVVLAPSAEAGEDLFAPVASVLQSPRCLNCHPRGDRPHQGDDAHIHRPAVVRGSENLGAPGMSCSACHGTANNLASGVPGAPHWHLAPRSMGWEGLSRQLLCKTLTDRTKNGNRGVEDLVTHMTSDPLVQWAWTPGGTRQLPPLGQTQFHAAVRAWAAAGARCPGG